MEITEAGIGDVLVEARPTKPIGQNFHQIKSQALFQLSIKVKIEKF